MKMVKSLKITLCPLKPRIPVFLVGSGWLVQVSSKALDFISLHGALWTCRFQNKMTVAEGRQHSSLTCRAWGVALGFHYENVHLEMTEKWKVRMWIKTTPGWKCLLRARDEYTRTTRVQAGCRCGADTAMAASVSTCVRNHARAGTRLYAFLRLTEERPP